MSRKKFKIGFIWIVFTSSLKAHLPRKVERIHIPQKMPKPKSVLKRSHRNSTVINKMRIANKKSEIGTRNTMWLTVYCLALQVQDTVFSGAGTSTLLHYISFEIWVVKYRWSIQIPNGQYRDHLVGQLTMPAHGGSTNIIWIGDKDLSYIGTWR